MNRLSVWGKNGKEREKACSRATNVKILRGGSRRGARGDPGPLLFLDQTEDRRAEKNFFGETGSLLYLRVWMTGPLSRSESGTDPPQGPRVGRLGIVPRVSCLRE